MNTNVCTHGHTHTRQTHAHQQKESPQRGAVHTVFTALLNYWLVVFLLLWEATPYEQGEGLAHKNCSSALAPTRRCFIDLGLPPKQDTCFSWHCLALSLSLLFSIFHHYLLFVSFILIFSPSFLPSLSPKPNLSRPRHLHKLDCRLCAAHRKKRRYRFALNYYESFTVRGTENNSLSAVWCKFLAGHKVAKASWVRNVDTTL